MDWQGVTSVNDVRLQPPFDPEFLEAIVANGIARGADDLSHTATWLLNLNDGDRMAHRRIV
jgi:hypothetical protein